MEVSRPGIESKLELYPMPQLQQCQILNPLGQGSNQCLHRDKLDHQPTAPQRELPNRFITYLPRAVWLNPYLSLQTQLLSFPFSMMGIIMPHEDLFIHIFEMSSCVPLSSCTSHASQLWNFQKCHQIQASSIQWPQTETARRHPALRGIFPGFTNCYLHTQIFSFLPYFLPNS